MANDHTSPFVSCRKVVAMALHAASSSRTRLWGACRRSWPRSLADAVSEHTPAWFLLPLLLLLGWLGMAPAGSSRTPDAPGYSSSQFRTFPSPCFPSHCDRAQFKKPEAGSGKVAKGSGMAIRAVIENCSLLTPVLFVHTDFGLFT